MKIWEVYPGDHKNTGDKLRWYITLGGAFLCLIGAFGQSLLAQSVTYKFQTGDYDLKISQWTLEDGLPSWQVQDIAEDPNGYLWMVSQAGLIRFDGRNFKTYSPGTYGLSSNVYGRLLFDRNQSIWLLAVEGDSSYVDVFNPITEQAVSLEVYLNHPLSLSRMAAEGFLRQADTIWILDPATGKGGRYTERWEALLSDTLVSLPNNGESNDYPHYYPCGGGLYWRRTKRLNYYDFQVVNHHGEIQGGRTFTRTDLGTIIRDDEQRIYFWPASSTKMTLDTLFYLGIDSITMFSKNRYPVTSWNRTAKQDFNRFLKINNDNFGLYVSPRNTFFFREGRILFPDLNAQLARTIGTKIHQKVFMSNDGTFWFISPQGLYRMRIRKQLFKSYAFADSEVHSVRGIVAPNDSQLIFNSYSGGGIVNLNENTWEPLPVDDRYYNFGLYHEKNHLWIGKLEGDVQRLNLVNKTIETYPLDGFPLDEYKGYRFQRFNDTLLLVASTLGVFRVHEQQKRLVPWCLQDLSVYFWHPNAMGIWLGTQRGVFLLDKAGRVMKHFPILEQGEGELRTYFIHEDNNGVFWLATNQGLFQWTPATNNYQRYGLEEGLSNERIHAIFEDKFGRLWLSSNYGLMCFRKSDNYTTTYLEKDGLPSNEFNFLAYHQRADGKLFLGGVNGIIGFDPDAVPQEQLQSIVLHVEEVAVYNRDTEAVTLQNQTAIKGEPILMAPTDNRVEVRLISHYFSGERMVYEWRLPEQSSTWQNLQTPFLQLNNPAKGTYPLEFRAYPMGNRSAMSSVLVLNLIVGGYIYEYWWFWGLVAMAVLGGVLLLLRLRQERLRRQNEQLQQQVRERTIMLEEQLDTIEKQAQELRHLDTVKSRFFANVSHELRTPLTLILGPLEVLLREEGDGTKREELERIKRNAIQLGTLSEELLDLVKLEAGELKLETEKVRIEPLLRRVFSAFISFADYKGIVYNLVLDLPPQLILLLDVGKTERILNNLLSNALKFTTVGGQVLVKGIFSENQLTIRVQDTGPGITVEELPHIFNRYYRSKEQKDEFVPGTGIGLAICKELAEVMGAEIQVDSVPQRGSTFSLCISSVSHEQPEALIPIDGISTAQYIKEYRGNDQSVVSTISTLTTILVVEDNADMQSYLVRILQHHYHVITALDGRAALAVLDKQPVKLIIADVMMVGMDGFSLLKSLRENGLWLPFILLSARNETADRVRGLRLGVDVYLTKPFVPEELLAQIENLLRHQSMLNQQVANQQLPALFSSTDTSTDSTHIWQERLATFVHSQLARADFKVGDLGVHFGVSERTIRDKIKTLTGKTPKQYIQQARLEQARTLLMQRRYATVAEVSFACGFRSTAHFTKLFKVHFGQLPSTYL